MTDKPQDETIKDQIIALLEKGYKRDQLIRDFKFAERTVDAGIRAFKELDNGNAEDAKEAGDGIPVTRKTDGDIEMPRLPLVLKAGAGQEMISPEGILQSYVLSDGDAGTWMFKGMMLLRAAQLMNLTDVEIMKGQAEAQAMVMKPILDVMEQARKDMDAAAQRAKESNAEIAEAAAMGAAGGVLGRIDAKFAELKQQKTDIATVPNPMKGLMARTMEMMMNRMSALMGGGQAGQVGAPPGFVDTRSQVQGGQK